MKEPTPYAIAEGDIMKLKTVKTKFEKARKRALKRKRDKQGHFLPNEQNKK